MTTSGRQPSRALLAVVATCAILLAAALLPAFGAAAPAHEVAATLAEEVGGQTTAAPAQSGQRAGGAQTQSRRPARGSKSGSSGPRIDLGSFTLPMPQGGSLLSAAAGASGKIGGGGMSGASGLLAQLAKFASGTGMGAPTVSGSIDASGMSAGSGGGSGISASAGGGSGSGSGAGTGSGTGDGAAQQKGCAPVSDTYTVCFEEKIVPGTETTVRVYTADGPAAGVRVFFNGNLVGQTDESGTVTGRVPYTRELRVVVRGGDGGTAGARGERYHAVATPGGGTVNASVVTDLNVSVVGEADPGSEGVVRVTIEGSPVPDAVVRIDGERVGKTDDQGRLTVTFPVATATTVQATRGELAATKRIQLAAIETGLRGSNVLGVALPGQSATVVVTDEGEPVESATVSFGSQTAGQTGPNGTIATTLPMQPSVEVTVETSAGLVVHTRKQLWVLPSIALLVALGLAGGLGITYHRSSVTGRGFLEQARALLGGLAADLLGALVSVAIGFEATVDRLRERLATLRRTLRNLDVLTLADVRAWLREYIRARRARTQARLDELRERLRRRGPESRADGDATTAGETTFGPRERVERAWHQLLATLSLRRTRTMTPGEVADRAIDAGLPRSAVEQLTDAFRTVEYSSADPAQHAETAERAASTLTETEEGTNDA